MKIYLIRHSMTEGNLKKRYIGRTDEALCPEGVKLVQEHVRKGFYPEAEKVYASPMKRCIQTAEYIFPERRIYTVEELSECDFGIFENKNYKELSAHPAYQEWVDSGGTLPFPGGESLEEFKERTLKGFDKSVRECIRDSISSAAYVVHGGTIMCIMEKYAYPRRGYYDYQIENGEGYELIIADSDSGDVGVSYGSAFRRPGVFISSGTDDRSPDHRTGKNYKKMFSEDKKR